MNRRAILAILGASTATVAGCLGGPERDGEDNEKGDEERNYEPCNKQLILFSLLPDEVKKEVETAIEEGEYRTEGELLYDQVEGPGVEALVRNGMYYESDITRTQDGSQILSFTEVTVTHDQKRDLLVQNVTEDEWSGTITIENSDGRRLVEEEVTIDSFPTDETPKQDTEDGIDNRITRLPISDEFGRYIITFESKTGEREQVEDTIGRTDAIGILVVVDDNEIRTEDEYLPGGVEFAEGDDTFNCMWDGKELRY